MYLNKFSLNYFLTIFSLCKKHSLQDRFLSKLPMLTVTLFFAFSLKELKKVLNIYRPIDHIKISRLKKEKKKKIVKSRMVLGAGRYLCKYMMF